MAPNLTDTALDPEPVALNVGSSRRELTAMTNAGVRLRDVQIAARHADPPTTMRYDRAGKSLDRHPNSILAAFMGSGR